MSTITGKVEKAFKNNAGFGSLLVDGNWYGTGKEVKSELEGQVVSFDTTSKTIKGKTYFNVDGAITPVAGAPAPAAAPQAGGNRSFSDEKQILIMRQNAWSTGTQIIAAALKAGALSLPTAKGKALDAVFGYVDAAAEHVFGSVTAGTAFEEIDPEEEAALPPAADFKPTDA
jgi:hypothetical protein